MPDITSASNPRVRALVALRRRRVRDTTGLTLIDGYEELSLALDAGVRPRELYVCPELLAPGVEQISPRCQAVGARVYTVSRTVFTKIAYREGPDGILAVAAGVDQPISQLGPLADNPLVLIAQGVEKPGNLGAMLRTADAAGAHGLISADPVTDWGNPNIIRASKGSVFSVPIAADSTAATLDWLDEAGIALVATTPDTKVRYTDIDYTGPVAIAVGTEKTGLDAAMLAAATHRVAIPMFGTVDSLNVATSAAIVLYEAVRQRTSYAPE